jgi:small-conductance mechanosensitive channel
MQNNYANLGIESFKTAFQTLGTGIAVFVPKFIVALFLFLVLWWVAVALGKLVEQVVRSLKIDSVLEGLGAEEPLSRAGYKVNTGAFIGGLVRWFFIVLALLVAVDILQLTAVSEFLSNVVLNYIPNVIVAAVIIIAAAVLADIAQKVLRASAQAAKMPSAHLIGAIAKWSIWIFALLAAFYQLGIAGPLIQTLLTAFVAMLALAGGLAFGLGGKEHAAQFIEKLKRDMH